ncbi:MAG: tyrosine-type recombinase/integrase [Myxococcales bacterium]|nr:tyrosine-type recombinase/integrase [Myxococcales bacterium]
MGSIYNRGGPTRPNVWIQYYVGGKRQREPIDKAPTGLTRSEANALEKDYRRKAARRLAEIEHGLTAPAPAESEQRSEDEDPLFCAAAKTWLKQRKADGYRAMTSTTAHINRHLVPMLGQLRISEVTTGKVRELVDERRRTAKLSGATVKRVLMTLSRMYNDLRERDRPWLLNPVGALSKATRKKLRSKHDPKRTPFVRTKSCIAAVYNALPEYLQPAYAVGVFAGLRTNEVLALRWADIDLDRRTITVQRQKVQGKRETGPLKNSKTRVVPINDTLLAVLKPCKLAGCDGLCFPSRRTGDLMYDDTPHDALQRVLAKLPKVLARALEPAPAGESLTWYRATRHTFASHWVMDGGSIEKLCEILGHCSVVVTERYAHLRPDAFGAADYAKACVDLTVGRVIDLDSHRIATDGGEAAAASR